MKSVSVPLVITEMRPKQSVIAGLVVTKTDFNNEYRHSRKPQSIEDIHAYAGIFLE